MFLIVHLGTSANDDLVSALDTFQQAFEKADIETLSSMTPADYLHTNASGKIIPRTGWLNWLKSRNVAMSEGSFNYSKYQVSDRRIIQRPGFAVVSQLIETSGNNNGHSFAMKIRTTETWSKETGTWQRVSFHDSYIE